MSDPDLVFDEIESLHPVTSDLRWKRDLEQPHIVSNDLDELFNEEEEDDDDDGEDEEEDEGDVSSLRDSRETIVDEDNHWLMRGVKRIRRSIDDFFGSPAQSADDEAERHMKKVNGHGRKGKGKGRSEKKAKTKAERVARKQQREEKRKAREDKQKARQEKQRARDEKRKAKELKPASRVRRQHMQILGNDADDEDFVDGSGSGPGPFQASNKLCEILEIVSAVEVI